MAFNDATSPEDARNVSTPMNDSADRNPSDNVPSEAVLNLWAETAEGIDRNQTVIWKNAVDTLDNAVKFLPKGSEDARRFVEGHMKQCVSILLDQQPSKIGQLEKNCVEDSLKLAVTLISMDLKMKNDIVITDDDTAPLPECKILESLAQILNRKRTYYKGTKPNWNMNLSGAPEVRVHMIQKFRSLDGWANLASYLENRAEKHIDQFPSAETLQHVLGALGDIIPQAQQPVMKGLNAQQQQAMSAANAERDRETIEVILRVCNSIMKYLIRMSKDSALKKQVHDVLAKVLYGLKSIHDRLPPSRRAEMNNFYKFWRDLTFTLITSSSLPVRLYGWDQVNDLIEASRGLRPPPKFFLVDGAGCDFVNGKYKYAGPLDEFGYAIPGGEPSYVRGMEEDSPEAKKITLFRCTMRSQQKWWFLSEADEVQPGTDKDIDYYQHKSRPNEDVSVPPSSGWLTCRNTGEDPAPVLRSEGLMVPEGEELNTLEHQLAKWAIDNKIIELVLGDSVHREVVARSQTLIKFLANMCEGGPAPAADPALSQESHSYCLQASHLLLAWRTCTSKADAAVSTEVYTLLVSILPSLPEPLAIELLEAIQKSLRDGTSKNDKKDFLPEVAEFCTALARLVPDDGFTGGGASSFGMPISNDVRRETLNLLWAVLTHPNAHSIKSYDLLKQYVTKELQIEPNGAFHRKDFMKSCTAQLAANAQSNQNEFDEDVALQKVKLTRFVLEACPPEQAASLVTENDAELPLLLYDEVCAYLLRKNSLTNVAAVKKMALNSESAVSKLAVRLAFIRYSYGLSRDIFMTTDQLDRLWTLCLAPSDREHLMEFLASASGEEPSDGTRSGGIQVNDTGGTQPLFTAGGGGTSRKNNCATDAARLSSAFTPEVREYAFQKLICGGDVNWSILGMRSYKSFQTLFTDLRLENNSSNVLEGPDIDALWKICLTAGDDLVASQSLRDLLFVYESSPSDEPSQQGAWKKSANNLDGGGAARPQTLVKSVSSRLSDTENAFIKRIFECLVQVRHGLEAGDPSSERAAERCLRILNSAVGQEHAETNSIGDNSRASASSSQIQWSLPALDMTKVNSATDALKRVPHGLRGQASYWTVSIVGKRTSQNAGANSSSTSMNIDSVDDTAVATPTPKLPSSVRFPLNVHPLETLLSLKMKVAEYTNHPLVRVKAMSINGRQGNKSLKEGSALSTNSLNTVAENTTVSQLGISDGCEILFLLAGQHLPSSNVTMSKKNQFPTRRSCLDLTKMFADDDEQEEKDHFFDTLLSVLEALPAGEDEMVGRNDNLATTSTEGTSSSKLVWDLLLAMPSNPRIVDRVRALALVSQPISGSSNSNGVAADSNPESTMMAVDESPQRRDEWGAVLDGSCLHRSVYTMQVVDSFLQPAPEIFCGISDPPTRMRLVNELSREAKAFRQGFVSTGGFDAFLFLFTQGSQQEEDGRRRRFTRRGDAVALRVLKCCFFGELAVKNAVVVESGSIPELDDAGKALLGSISRDDARNMLRRIAEVVVLDPTVLDATILDALAMIRLLLRHHPQSQSGDGDNVGVGGDDLTLFFARLPNQLSEHFVTRLLLRQNASIFVVASASSATRVRKSVQELVISNLRFHALPWLAEALKSTISVEADYTDEFFAVLRELVDHSIGVDPNILKTLGTATCDKIAAQRRTSNSAVLMVDRNTGVLCGCLQLLIAIIDTCGGSALIEGATLLLKAAGSSSWARRANILPENEEDAVLIDVMGALFDGYLSSAENAAVAPLCSDKASRSLGFEAVSAAARACTSSAGYITLNQRINEIIATTAPFLRYRWGVNALEGGESSSMRNHSGSAALSKYSGLRNQGCTCYMNSFLQQMFMMPGLRKQLCAAPLPSSYRSIGSNVVNMGPELIGKRIALQWATGVTYEAVVKAYDSGTRMHTIQYCPLPTQLPNPTVLDRSSSHRQQQLQMHQQRIFDEIRRAPTEMPEEISLTEGRPGKETGVFEIVNESGGEANGDVGGGAVQPAPGSGGNTSGENEEQAAARRLLEELQRTFVHLEEGTRGRCFDPRSLVEASGVLKLEFDVWQQNDASEYAMKLLDRLEVPLKRYAPKQFKYLESTFGLKQTKQKLCKECGLKTNREENLMNIDCQIRGKTDIHEALETMCEVEYMEGDNKVFCDNCKKKCDTILRTAISALPEMLILSLKRFDLDFNTFETVKLNSRLAFGHSLNMKKYTLEGLEALDNAKKKTDDNNTSGSGYNADGDAEMAGEDAPPDNPLDALPDKDYEYELVGVLVHAGVAQGGHYYSFIKDRSAAADGGGDKTDNNTLCWYRFDDDDVTPFDPVNIETECFGGKFKKETKWPNGQVHTVESEQFANALMLFYEKVDGAHRRREQNADGAGATTTGTMNDDVEEEKSDCVMVDNSTSISTNLMVADSSSETTTTTGYDVFQNDVRRANKKHGWHEFLADSEFQDFLKNLLNLVCISSSANDDVVTTRNDDSMDLSPSSSTGLTSPDRNVNSYKNSVNQHPCRLSVIQLIVNYIFDVILHSNDKGGMNDWESRICNVLEMDGEAARWLVRELVVRSAFVSKNWLRTFYLDCYDDTARMTANTIIKDAILKCVSVSPDDLVGEEESTNLQRWIEAWQSQNRLYEDEFVSVVSTRQQPSVVVGDGPSPSCYPTQLQGAWSEMENPENILNNRGSAVGRLISVLVTYIELCPRVWRNCMELLYLFRDLSCDSELLRLAFAAAQIPARMICLTLRENSPRVLKMAFPGSALSQEAASMMVRSEASPSSSHAQVLLPSGLGGVGGNTTAGMHHHHNQSPKMTERLEMDVFTVYENLACVLGLPFLRKEPILDEKVSSRGRIVPILSEKAQKAFEVIFDESKNPNVNGMGQQEINKYMEMCGVDFRNHAAQKIIQKLSKYNSITYREGHKDVRYLTVNGFLDYYRDTAVTNEAQARHDLNTFGFRPDFSRRGPESRLTSAVDTTEEIASDIAQLLSSSDSTLFVKTPGPLLEAGLNCFQLYYPQCHIHNISHKEILTIVHHILAAGAYEKPTTELINETLEVLSQAPVGNNSVEIPHMCLMIFRVLLCIPDSKQDIRIATTMLSTHKCAPYAENGVGIIVAARELSRQSRDVPHLDIQVNAAVDRYIEIVKILYNNVASVAEWMKEHRDEWVWMEQPRVNHHHAAAAHHENMQRHGREGGAPSHGGGGANNAGQPLYSDSDINQGFGNESEEDDDFQFDQHHPSDANVVKPVLPACRKVTVSGAGIEAINGEFINSGTVDFAPKFNKLGILDGKEESFALYRCQLLDRSRKWFISIVPQGSMPGTNKDIDFYWASCGEDEQHAGSNLPPRTGWMVVKDKGKTPVPTVEPTLFVPNDGGNEEDIIVVRNGGGGQRNNSSNNESWEEDDEEEDADALRTNGPGEL